MMNKRSSMKKLLVGITTLVMLFSLTFITYAATITVDLFNGVVTTLTANPGVQTITQLGASGTNMFAPERDSQLWWVSGPGETTLQINRFGSNTLRFNQDSGVV